MKEIKLLTKFEKTVPWNNEYSIEELGDKVNELCSAEGSD